MKPATLYPVDTDALIRHLCNDARSIHDLKRHERDALMDWIEAELIERDELADIEEQLADIEEQIFDGDLVTAEDFHEMQAEKDDEISELQKDLQEAEAYIEQLENDLQQLQASS